MGIGTTPFLLTCMCRKGLSSRGRSSSEDRWQRAARSLNLTDQQVHRGLQYRSHVLGVIDKCARKCSFFVDSPSAIAHISEFVSS